jgi:hypothetical protein
MSDKIVLEVTGIDETVAAFHKLDRFDIERAEHDAGVAVLPTVVANTRTSTGLMASAWAIEGQAFINTVEYSPMQEFGTIYVEPTFAVFRAWEEQEERVAKVFEDQILHDAAKEGFTT